MDLYRRVRVARPGLRRDRGRCATLLARETVTAYIGFDPDRVEPARRHPAADDGAGAAAALRPFADRARRRRHRADRRSERQDRGAGAADRSSRSRRTSPASARSSRGFSTSTTPPNPARLVNNADWLTTLERDRVPARRRQALHRQLHAGEGVGEAPPRERGRHLVHRVQLLAAAGVRLPASCSIATAARCRWAAAISGATSPPASI